MRQRLLTFVIFGIVLIALGEWGIKKGKFAAGHGMQQALDYGASLQVPFIFSSNGKGFVFHDRTGLIVKGEADLPLDQFPSPDVLWAKYREWKGLTPAEAPVAAVLKGAFIHWAEN